MGSLAVSALLAGLLLISTCEARRFRIGGNAGAGFGFQIGSPNEGNEGEDGEVGDPCEPSSPRPCGKKTLLSGPVVEQLSEEEFGPNVCKFTFSFEVKTYEFELKRSYRCGFQFSCPLVCACTGECTEETMTVEKEVVDCCEGFTTPRPTPLEIASGAYSYSSYKSCKRRTRVSSSGCPIRLCPDEAGTDAPTDMPTDVPTDMPTNVLPTEEFVLPTDDAEGLA